MKYKLIVDDKVISEQELEGDFSKFSIETTKGKKCSLKDINKNDKTEKPISSKDLKELFEDDKFWS